MPELFPKPLVGRKDGTVVLRAESLQQIIEAIPRVVTGNGVLLNKYGDRLVVQQAGDYVYQSGLLQSMVVISEQADYLTCVVFNFTNQEQPYDPTLGTELQIDALTGTIVYVAKPYILQASPWENQSVMIGDNPIIFNSVLVQDLSLDDGDSDVGAAPFPVPYSKVDTFLANNIQVDISDDDAVVLSGFITINGTAADGTVSSENIDVSGGTSSVVTSLKFASVIDVTATSIVNDPDATTEASVTLTWIGRRKATYSFANIINQYITPYYFPGDIITARSTPTGLSSSDGQLIVWEDVNTAARQWAAPESPSYVIQLLDDPRLGIGIHFSTANIDGSYNAILGGIYAYTAPSSSIWAFDNDGSSWLDGPRNYVGTQTRDSYGNPVVAGAGPLYISLQDNNTNNPLGPGVGDWWAQTNSPALNELTYVADVVSTVAITNTTLIINTNSSPTDFVAYLEIIWTDADASITDGTISIGGDLGFQIAVSETIDAGAIGGTSTFNSARQYRNVSSITLSGIVGNDSSDTIQVRIYRYAAGVIRRNGNYYVTNTITQGVPGSSPDWTDLGASDPISSVSDYNPAVTYSKGQSVQEVRPIFAFNSGWFTRVIALDGTIINKSIMTPLFMGMYALRPSANPQYAYMGSLSDIFASSVSPPGFQYGVFFADNYVNALGDALPQGGVLPSPYSLGGFYVPGDRVTYQGGYWEGNVNPSGGPPGTNDPDSGSPRWITVTEGYAPGGLIINCDGPSGINLYVCPDLGLGRKGTVTNAGFGVSHDGLIFMGVKDHDLIGNYFDGGICIEVAGKNAVAGFGGLILAGYVLTLDSNGVPGWAAAINSISGDSGGGGGGDSGTGPITFTGGVTGYIFDLTVAPSSTLTLIGSPNYPTLVDPSNWSGSQPTTMVDAIERCAALLKSLNGGAGP